jgi:DNA modification methylase
MSYTKKSDLKGKLAEDLKKSAEELNIKEEFGSIPKSIMKFKKSKILMDLINNDDNDIAKIEEGTAQARGGGYAQNLRYSIYNPDQAEFIIKYFTKEKQLILDPFMGRATRPIISLHSNRQYIGFDTCSKTIEINLNLIKEKNLETSSYKFIHGDSTDLFLYEKNEILDRSIDAVFSCPPYYDIEKYSNEPGDLSYLTKEDFDKKIDSLFSILANKIKLSNYSNREFYPVIFTVGSIRQGDKGILDMDWVFQNIAKKNGFVLHDKLFTENLTPAAGFTFRRNYLYSFLTKNYETTLIFMKYN